MARREPPEEPLLFDLPLGAPEGAEEGARGAPARPRRSATAAREGPSAAAPAGRLQPAPIAFGEPGDALDEGPEAAVDDEPGLAASRRGRLLGGLADLLFHAAFLVLGLIGARQLGIRPRTGDWPGFALFVLAFSFLYGVVSLAFWGHTLGMVWAGITSRSRDGEPLSFDQAVRRWLGGILTAALLGLPLLLSWRGRALSDLLSGSETVSAPAAAD
jgi:uncharacterized RDD family membrane protein YckC